MSGGLGALGALGPEVYTVPQKDKNGLSTSYLEGQGDLVSRIITPITHIVTPIIPIINLLTKSP